MSDFLKCPKCSAGFSSYRALEVHETDHDVQIVKSKRSTLKPTERMLERIQELKGHPVFASGENLEWLHNAIVERGMLRNMGMAGRLIGMMKEKVAKWEEENRQLPKLDALMAEKAPWEDDNG